MTATATKTATARELAQAWSDTFQQHNLLATATADQRNAFIKRNIDTYNRLAAPVLDAPEQTNAQYFTPKLHANMRSLMNAGGIHQQIAQKIALVFAACESIAEFTAPRLPSHRHAAAWTKNLIDDAKAIRFMLAQLEEQEARASEYPEAQLGAEDGENAEDDLSPEEHALIAELAGGPARPSTVDVYGDDEECGNAILCAAIDHIYRSFNYQLDNRTAGDALAIDLMSGLRGMDWGDLREYQPHFSQPRASSVDLVEQYAARVGTATSAEIGEEILRRAADYLYNRQNGATWEHADHGDAAAVDALDDYRTVLANGNDLARITDEAGNVDLCEIEPEPSTRVVRVLERLTTTSN